MQNSNWFEDERFWQDFYPYMFDEKRFQSAPLQVEKILTLIEFTGTDVLDLCCGPARHSVVLAKHGCHVTGVDRSKFLLSKAAEHANMESASVEFVCDDMRDFVRPDSFDLALNLFTSFGYFEDKDDDLRVLQNIHTSLRKNGALLIDVVAKEVVAKTLQPTTSQLQQDGTLLVERHEIRDDWTRIRNEWILIKDGATNHHHFEHTLYSGEELRNRMLQAGFSNVRLFGSLDGSPFDINASRLVATGRK